MKKKHVIAALLLSLPFCASLEAKDYRTVMLAAHNATAEEKAISDLVCTGENDEKLFKEAIDRLPDGGTIKLSSGNFYFDEFASNEDGIMPTAVLFPNKTKSYKTYDIIGTGLPIVTVSGEDNNFTTIKISDKCYDALSSDTQVAVFRSVNNKVKFNLTRLGIHAKSNNKPVVYICAYYSGNVNIEDVRIWNDDFARNNMPSKKCIGIWGTNGSNPGVSYEWKKCFVFGCYEGFRCCGEHLIVWQCGTRNCYYGYTFDPEKNSYGAYTHPMTLINCCDELSAHMPYFGPVNGETYQTDNLGSRQAVTLIDFNLEWEIEGQSFRPEPPRYATEAVPGMFKGTIEYTIQSGYGGNSKNDKLIPFWAEGSGHGFVTRNQAHDLSGSSAERRSYSDAKAANYMQTYYDTDLQKMLVFDGKVWKDFSGKTVK